MNILDLVLHNDDSISLDDVLLKEDNRKQIDQLIKEHNYIEEIHHYGLPVNNKILLHGCSGCGKTTTAKGIAQALGKPILILNLSNVVSSRIGETSQNIKQVFDKAARERAVLFLDEFDQIGKARGNDDKDVGEMRRLVNTLIQLIDYFPEKSMLICATNHAEIIDKALTRRFQLHIGYALPSDEELNKYYDLITKHIPENLKCFERKFGISYAEAKDSAFTQIKACLIADLEAKVV
jgi:SpoVK/Ycf46/Vps4 family AAA+-type ATPase